MDHRSKIKALFFDIGGVLVRVDSKSSIRKLADKLKVSEEGIQDAMSRDLLIQYEKGHLNSNQFYENLLVNCASAEQMDLSTFKLYWQDVLFPQEETQAFLKRAAQDFPVWLLSNTNDFHYDIMLKKFPFMQWVTGGTYSFMVGSMKPEPLIYELTIQKSGFRPEEILFIDDLEENVLAARQVGLRAIQFVDYERFKLEAQQKYPELGYLL
ncbi:MAG: HAD family phosphatase [Candidatus Marinimicrobia bacterium]|nr:HAD family phosphatase [Candidatus Neomarinimicrobiota bacterium]